MSNKIKKFKLLETPHLPVVEEVKKRLIKIKAKTQGQQDLLNTINDCDLTLVDGPAGTGKTTLALTKGFEGLKNGDFERLILLRPFQECGREMGALPGDMNEKIAPNMKAFTELFSMFATTAEIANFSKENKLTIDTIEFLRGLTFHRSFIVIDEAQNCTYKQLKMLLTRIGSKTKMVVCGDVRQTDLPEKMWHFNEVPFKYVMDKLELLDCPSIGLVDLTIDDIVRHGLVKLICGALP